MPNFIFKDTKAIGLEDDKPSRLTFSPAGLPGIPNLEDEFWVTDVQGGIEPNYQIQYAFSNNVYVNAFTPRLTLFQLDGIYIPSKFECGRSDTPDNSSQNQPAFMQMYWRYNIVDANADPDNQRILTVSFNQIVIRGFMVKVNIQRYNKDSIDGHRFNLHLLGFMETGEVTESDVQSQKDTAATAEASGEAGGASQDSPFSIRALNARRDAQRAALAQRADPLPAGQSVIPLRGVPDIDSVAAQRSWNPRGFSDAAFRRL
jgi:hypothetical protein